MRHHRDQIAVSGEAFPFGFLALFGGANERIGYVFAKRNRGSQQNPGSLANTAYACTTSSKQEADP